jgi:hypothetical protein
VAMDMTLVLWFRYELNQAPRMKLVEFRQTAFGRWLLTSSTSPLARCEFAKPHKLAGSRHGGLPSRSRQGQRTRRESHGPHPRVGTTSHRRPSVNSVGARPPDAAELYPGERMAT